MSLERIFLVLFVLVVVVYATLLATTLIVFMPWGLIGLVALLFAGYIAWRLVTEHTKNAEDRYYEENFDK